MAKKKIVYDFREGLEVEKIVYRRKVCCDCASFWLYIACIILTWIYAIGLFIAAFIGYIYYEPQAFPAFLAVWLACVIAFWTYSLVKLGQYYSRRNQRRKRRAEEAERKQREDNEKVQAILNARKNKNDQQIELHDIKPELTDKNHLITDEKQEKENLVDKEK